MAFITPKYEFDAVRRAIMEQFAPAEQDRVFSLLEPFVIEGGQRIPLCILKLAAGRTDEVISLVEHARRDYRDVIFWAEYPEEAALDTPKKIDDFQNLLEWAGQPRSTELEQEKQRLIAERDRQDKGRPTHEA